SLHSPFIPDSVTLSIHSASFVLSIKNLSRLAKDANLTTKLKLSYGRLRYHSRRLIEQRESYAGLQTHIGGQPRERTARRLGARAEGMGRTRAEGRQRSGGRAQRH